MTDKELDDLVMVCICQKVTEKELQTAPSKVEKQKQSRLLQNGFFGVLGGLNYALLFFVGGIFFPPPLPFLFFFLIPFLHGLATGMQYIKAFVKEQTIRHALTLLPTWEKNKEEIQRKILYLQRKYVIPKEFFFFLPLLKTLGLFFGILLLMAMNVHSFWTELDQLSLSLNILSLLIGFTLLHGLVAQSLWLLYLTTFAGDGERLRKDFLE